MSQDQSKHTFTELFGDDGQRDRELRDRLRAAVRRHWWLIVLVPLVVHGCGVRTIYVPDGTPVRLRETVRNAKVWVKDAEGKVVPGRMDLREGWYCLSMPESNE